MRAGFTDDEGQAMHLDQRIEASRRRVARQRLVAQITETHGGNKEVADTWRCHDCNNQNPVETANEWADRTLGGMVEVAKFAWCLDAAERI